MPNSPETKRETLKIRTIWLIIRAAGLVSWTVAFVVLFLIASILVAAFEPGIGGFGNAAWLMFQVVTTIGLGDYTCVSVAGRICAILLSVYSVKDLVAASISAPLKMGM